MIDAIHHGDFNDVSFVEDDHFGFLIPTTCPEVPSELLIPRSTWDDQAEYDRTKEKLIRLFQSNFNQFSAKVNPSIKDAGPVLS